VFHDDQLFDEVPEAWLNGPVYRKVYDKFFTESGFKRHVPLVYKVKEEELNKKFNEEISALGLEEDQESLIMSTLNKYAPLSDNRLVLLTHKELPWNEARSKCGPTGICSEPISLETMKTFYSNHLKSQDL